MNDLNKKYENLNFLDSVISELNSRISDSKDIVGYTITDSDDGMKTTLDFHINSVDRKTVRVGQFHHRTDPEFVRVKNVNTMIAMGIADLILVGYNPKVLGRDY